MKGLSVINKVDTSSIREAVMQDGLIKVLPFKDYKTKFTREEILNFMIEDGIYVLPTIELIEYLKKNIIGKAIEIGCGNGAIGRALNIPITDSMAQARPEMIEVYKMMQQEPIVYPADVEKLGAQSAIKKYKPDTVIAAFVTHKFNGKTGFSGGVNEEFILERCRRYIMIGNLQTHTDKPILRRWHSEHEAEWIITRSANQSLNRIFIFNQSI